MDDKKQEDTNAVSADTTADSVSAPVVNTEASNIVNEVASPTEGVPTPAPSVEVDSSNETTVVLEEANTTNPNSKFNLRAYIGAVVVILVIAIGLMFVLEKEGRISTGLFSGVIEKMEANSPAAVVNGVKIPMREFKSSVEQLTEMSATQGANTSDPAVVEQLKTQAIDTLVNAELLRQAAVKEGMSATQEQIDTRFNEIQEGIGGAEQLAARMAEFGVTEESLRRDIENEFLIQGLFNVKIATNTIEVSETEIAAVYERAGGAGAGLPPIADVREQIVAQIRFEKEQGLINEYLETLKADAKVEISV